MTPLKELAFSPHGGKMTVREYGRQEKGAEERVCTRVCVCVLGGCLRIPKSFSKFNVIEGYGCHKINLAHR